MENNELVYKTKPSAQTYYISTFILFVFFLGVYLNDDGTTGAGFAIAILSVFIGVPWFMMTVLYFFEVIHKVKLQKNAGIKLSTYELSFISVILMITVAKLLNLFIPLID